VPKWAGVKDWSPLDNTASKVPAANTSNPTKNQSPGSQMLADHFRNQADKITMPQGMPKLTMVQKLIDDLMDAMASQGQVFQQTFNQLKAPASEFLDISLGEVLKRLAGILVESVLGTTQVVVDALFNVLYDLGNAGIAVLDTKIHIPIISDILNAIGVPDLSFLDLVTWIGATGITVIYKIANDRAPFPDDATSRALIEAKDWTSFKAALGSTSPAAMNFKMTERFAKMDISVSHTTASAVYTTGHTIAGFVAFTGNFLFRCRSHR